MTIDHAAPLLDRDGNPLWVLSPGEWLVDGVQAWERLGVGHRCETWLAWSTPLWCPVVVKMARPHQVDHPRARQSLYREVLALQGNLHPSLPRLYAAGLDAPRPYVVIEHVDGRALDEVLAWRGPMSAASVISLAAQLLAALVPLHGRGIAHLDIKPDNVVVRDGRPVLVDFGSARELGSKQPPGHPVGTLGYAAPEMEACEPVSAGMDVYGVGVVLREALRPRRPLTSAAARRLSSLIEQLTAEDPAERPDLRRSLRAVAALSEDRHLPWPSWAEPPTVRT